MWSQGRFKRDGLEGDDMAAFAERTASLGFPHIEINYVIPAEGVEALLATNHVGVSSVHSPCPRVPTPDGRKSDALNLASPNADERTFAVVCARAAVDIAVRAEAPAIVVHLGGVGSEIFPEERELRKLFDAGTRDGDHVEVLRRGAETARGVFCFQLKNCEAETKSGPKCGPLLEATPASFLRLFLRHPSRHA